LLIYSWDFVTFPRESEIEDDDVTYKVISMLTLNLLKTTIVAPPSNASKWQMGFNSMFKGLNTFCFFVI